MARHGRKLIICYIYISVFHIFRYIGLRLRYHIDVIKASWRLRFTDNATLCKTNLFLLSTKKTIKLRVTGPLWGESVGDSHHRGSLFPFHIVKIRAENEDKLPGLFHQNIPLNMYHTAQWYNWFRFSLTYRLMLYLTTNSRRMLRSLRQQLLDLRVLSIKV